MRLEPKWLRTMWTMASAALRAAAMDFDAAAKRLFANDICHTVSSLRDRRVECSLDLRLFRKLRRVAMYGE